MTEFATLPCL